MRLEWKPEGERSETVQDGIAPVTDLSSGTEKVLHPMAGMTLKEKISYLLTYYGLKTLVTIIVTAALLSMLIHYFTYREPVVQMLLINHSMEDTGRLEATFDEYLAQNDYDPKDTVFINSDIAFSMNDTTTDYLDVQSLMTLVATRKYSAFLSDEILYTQYGKSQYFRDIRNLLTEEEYQYFYENDAIVFGEMYRTQEIYPCGIKLTVDTCEWLKNTNYKECCFGILESDFPDDKAYALTQYILDYK